MKKILDIKWRGDVVPHEIICLNKNYQEDLVEFKHYIDTARKDPVVFSTQRMNHHGVIVTPYCGCYIVKLEQNGFSFKYDPRDEDEEPKFMRFDNVLGEIPCFGKDAGRNYFKITDEFFSFKKQYQEFFEKQLFTQGLGIELYYTYCPGSQFYEKEYKVRGNIHTINKSNIEYQHCLTWGAIRTSVSYVDMVPRTEIDRFIAPDRILSKVILHDSPFTFNPYDEE
jgi:hypothetical protein